MACAYKGDTRRGGRVTTGNWDEHLSSFSKRSEGRHNLLFRRELLTWKAFARTRFARSVYVMATKVMTSGETISIVPEAPKTWTLPQINIHKWSRSNVFLRLPRDMINGETWNRSTTCKHKLSAAFVCHDMGLARIVPYLSIKQRPRKE